MRAFILTFVLVAFALLESPSAEIVQVQLPELQGRYFTEDTISRCAAFQIDPAPFSIAGVSIRLTGTHNYGEIWCEAGAGISVPQPYPVAFHGSIPDAVNGDWWMASFPGEMPSGDFEITMPFVELYGWHVTWDFLLAGYGEVRLDGPGAGFLLICTPMIWPEATITDAVLLVDGEFPVSTKTGTWGSIKALYR